MKRDWVLTLLAMSPFLFSLTIAVLVLIRQTATMVAPAVIRKRTPNGLVRGAAETAAPVRRSRSVGGRQ
jgi:hypothetical protein